MTPTTTTSELPLIGLDIKLNCDMVDGAAVLPAVLTIFGIYRNAHGGESRGLVYGATFTRRWHWLSKGGRA